MNKRSSSLPLQFRDTAALSDNKIVKLISEQGKRLDIADWEIESLIELCKERKCFSLGMEVLSEYAALRDQAMSSFQLQRSGFHEILEYLRTTKTPDISIVSNIIVSISVHMITFFVSICRWRKLQWSPHSFLPLGADEIRSDYLFTEIIGNDAKKIVAALNKSNVISDIAKKHKLSLDIIISACNGEGQLEEVQLMGTNHIHTKDTHDDLLEIEKTSRCCVESLNEIFQMEYKIVNSWRSLLTVLNPREKLTLIRFFPTLRLPYSNIKSPTNDMDWFSSSLYIYDNAAVVLEDVLKSMATTAGGTLYVISDETYIKSDKESKSKNVLSKQSEDKTRDLPGVSRGNKNICKRRKSKKVKLQRYNDHDGIIQVKTHTRESTSTKIDPELHRNVRPELDLEVKIGKSPHERQNNVKSYQMDSESPMLTKSVSDGMAKGVKVSTLTSTSPGQFLAEELPSTSFQQLRKEITMDEKVMEKKPVGEITLERATYGVDLKISDTTNMVYRAHHSSTIGTVNTRSNSSSSVYVQNHQPSFHSDERYFPESCPDKLTSTISDSNVFKGAIVSNISCRKELNIFGPSQTQFIMKCLYIYPTLFSCLSRAEARAESQLIEIIMRNLRVDDLTIVNLAATKIQLWWRRDSFSKIVIKKRSFSQSIVLSVHKIIHEIVDAVLLQSWKRKKKNDLIIRGKAATTIQRMYLKGIIWNRGQREDIASDESNLNNVAFKNDYVVSKRHTDLSLLKIQCFVRCFISRKRVIEMRENYNNESYVYFEEKLNEMVLRKSKRLDSIIKVQSIWRGRIARTQLFVKMKAVRSILILYRRYKAHRNLKQNLRRIDRPVQIILKSLRGIPMDIVNNNSNVKVKVSVWWHPLLHIISNNDYFAAISSKKPQLIVTTPSFSIFRPQAGSIDSIEYNKTSSVSNHVTKDIPNNTTDVITTNTSSSTQNTSKIERVSMMSILSEINEDEEDEDDEEDVDDEEDEDRQDSSGERCLDGHEEKEIQVPKYSNIGPSVVSSGKLNFVSRIRQSMVLWSPPVVQEKNLSSSYSCSFDDSIIYIPSCHGNCVMKFEFLDGDRAFSNFEFNMSKFGDFMFWGGDYCDRVTSTSNTRGGDIKMNEEGNRPDDMMFSFRMSVGTPRNCKSQWAKVYLRGQRKTLGLFPSFWEKWVKYFISFDGNALVLFESKNSGTPILRIDVSSMRSLQCELGSPTQTNFGNMSTTEDNHDIILKCSTHDEIWLRFPDIKSRESWLTILGRCVQAGAIKDSL